MGHPQLVGTDRHITMGGVEISTEAWDSARKQLRIKASLVQDYLTTLAVYTAGATSNPSAPQTPGLRLWPAKAIPSE